MKNVLLPTDFSDNSWNAIKYAIKLYKDEVCTFHLLNIYTPIIYHVEYVLVYPGQFGLGDAVREAAQLSLSELEKRIANELDENPLHKFETVARFDTLIRGIKEIIEERKIDLIIMGTKGATGAKEVLFGSNTVQVIREVKCPLIAIPSDYEFEPPRKILFPTDLEVNYERTHIDILTELAKMHNSQVNALHVSTGYDLTEQQEENKKQLESIFRQTAFLYHELPVMEITEAINSFQIKQNINFLAMINNKHSFFENLFFKNTINQIGFHLNIPFLVIPAKI